MSALFQSSDVLSERHDELLTELSDKVYDMVDTALGAVFGDYLNYLGLSGIELSREDSTDLNSVHNVLRDKLYNDFLLTCMR